MIASSRAALALAVLLSAAGAAAQVGPPQRLIPLTPPAETAPEPPAELPAQRGESVPRLPAIRVDPLQAPDPSGVGLIDAAKGGFAPDLWRGSRAATVLALLPLLPAASPSPTMQGLERRLLLSTATPPAGANGLLGLRLERLAAMGRLADAVELAKLAGSRFEDPALSLARIDAALLGGDNDAACGEAKAEQDRRASPALTKVVAFCAVVQGDKRAAAVTGGLLREQGVQDDAFYQLLDQLTGERKPAKLASLKHAMPLHLAMLKQANQAIPEDTAREASPAVLRAIAAAPNVSPELKLEAAERAEAVGVLTPVELTEAYKEAKFTPEERAQALKPDAKRSSARTQALLFQAADLEMDAGKREEIARRALAQARADGRFAAAARAWSGVLSSLRPAPAGAGDIARALIAAGEINAARGWMEVDRATQAELWPLTVIADGRAQAWTAQRFAEWSKANEARAGTPDVKAQRAQLLLAMLEAVGYQVAESDWDAALIGPPRTAAEVPQVALWHTLRQAGLDRKPGESVLTALVALGDAGPARAHPAVMAAAVDALRLARFDANARALALEALIGQGL